MTLLDTDHFSVLRYTDHPRCVSLTAKLAAAHDLPVGTTIITFEEELRGWLAEIKRSRQIHKQVAVYDRLAKALELFSDWEIIRFDDRAASEFRRLQQQRIRIGTQDLKIASIALVQNALLLSANLIHFRQVPGLRVENWLD